MKEYLDKIYSIISDARLAIIEEGNKKQENAKDEHEKEKIKIASLHYDVLLNGILTFKSEIEDRIDEKSQLLNNTGVKIVLNEEPLDDVPTNGAYAYEGDVGAFVTDEDPVIIETKSGKKIVLDEDPVFYIDNTGVLDEDPISIMTKTGKKIILDEDPVGNTLASNKVIILSEDPIFNLGTTGNSFTLDEDPIFKLDDENDEDNKEEVLDSIEKIRDILRNLNNESSKIIRLDKEPVFNIENDGNEYTINEESKATSTKIVLDEDPVNIRIDLNEE